VDRAGSYGQQRQAAMKLAERQIDQAEQQPFTPRGEEERLRRAAAARKAHFTRLAFASVRARNKKKSQKATPPLPGKSGAVIDDTGGYDSRERLPRF
jgi:hypothetical protein